MMDTLNIYIVLELLLAEEGQYTFEILGYP